MKDLETKDCNNNAENSSLNYTQNSFFLIYPNNYSFKQQYNTILLLYYILAKKLSLSEHQNG